MQDKTNADMVRIENTRKAAARFLAAGFQALKKNASNLKLVLVLAAIAVPVLVLFSRYPETFELTWKGRMFYLFFLWLIGLELVISWKGFSRLQPSRPRIARIAGLAVIMIVPAVFALAVGYWGLDSIIIDFGEAIGVPFALPQLNPEAWRTAILSYDWPLSLEYLVLTASSAITVLLAYGKKGLARLSLSVAFLGVIGAVYMADTLYPAGYFSPFQALVPVTATLSASLLNWMGFSTFFLNSNSVTPALLVANQTGQSKIFEIGWPCAGVQSLLIYSLVMLVFFKKSAIPWKHRIAYFLIGAAVTYVINILRIATIFVIAIGGGDWRMFHDLWGELYSISWIVGYPLLILGVRHVWSRFHMRGLVADEKLIEKAPMRT
jgi:thaumarchaeosortase